LNENKESNWSNVIAGIAISTDFIIVINCPVLNLLYCIGDDAFLVAELTA